MTDCALDSPKRLCGRGSSGSEFSSAAKFEVFRGSVDVAGLTGGGAGDGTGTELGLKPNARGGDGSCGECGGGGSDGMADELAAGEPSRFLSMFKPGRAVEDDEIGAAGVGARSSTDDLLAISTARDG